ncbi:hypothetical protein HanRHA438_Chr14g0642741 [Helianthus annuus]|uniref:Uncharacterized protein n=1 Tax=Helianthus annuus TaxID=4232 RepID=A0A251SFZ1_HELAN|nr:hypothetical protein HanRHA438_Chr14g0642741 [Helianthus annuus]
MNIYTYLQNLLFFFFNLKFIKKPKPLTKFRGETKPAGENPLLKKRQLPPKFATW